MVFALTAILQTTLLLSPGNSGRILSKLGYSTSPGAIQTQPESQSPEVAEAAQVTNLVVKLYNQGKYGEALPLAKRAVQLREKALGADDPLVRSSLINLAEVYMALRRYGDAESLLERVVKSYEKTDPADIQVAKVLDRMALVQYAKGNLTKTEGLYKQALALREKGLGPDNSTTAQSILNLAEFYQFSGNYKQAEPLYRRLISIREKTSEPAHEEQLGEALDRYACLLRKLNRKAEAKEFEDRVYGAPVQWAGLLGPQDGAATDGFVLNGKAISLPKPSYPEEARAARVSGLVTVRVTINEKGNVVRACAVSGPTLLARESELAAYRAKFTSTMISGTPVKVTGTINYNYVAR